jgi:adenine deaminase
MTYSITGNFVNVPERKIYPVEITVSEGIISSITPIRQQLPANNYILPGFIDAHVHIESSMLVPSEFARLAVAHGTVATVSDPHEIGNVCGLQGVEYMIDNGSKVPFKFYFGAPSCVPATTFETAGAKIDTNDINELLRRKEIKYLSEMMNFPGVLNEEDEVMKKIAIAKKYGKPVDGHAPGLRGAAAKKYIDAGITTDHECFTREEALDKLHHGMKIIIREGSAAKNFEALIDLLNDHPDKIMFCSDDKHPDSLVAGHINKLCARAVAKDIDVFKILQAACINPVLHYQLDTGLLHEGDPADFIVVKDLKHFEVVQTFIDGSLVAENGFTKIEKQNAAIINNFDCRQMEVNEFTVEWKGEKEIIAIEAQDGQLITNKVMVTPKVIDNKIISDVENDVLKIVVVNRYQQAPVAHAFIKNFGLKKGALASSVAHDSHNIVAVGVDDESIVKAVNAVINCKGGISCITDTELILPLPVAGLMSTDDGYTVAEKYAAMDKASKDSGSVLSAPFMTLSFMALLVIPHIKLSDKGLFDGDNFSFV